MPIRSVRAAESLVVISHAGLDHPMRLGHYGVEVKQLAPRRDAFLLWHTSIGQIRKDEHSERSKHCLSKATVGTMVSR